MKGLHSKMTLLGLLFTNLISLASGESIVTTTCLSCRQRKSQLSDLPQLTAEGACSEEPFLFQPSLNMMKDLMDLKALDKWHMEWPKEVLHVAGMFVLLSYEHSWSVTDANSGADLRTVTMKRRLRPCSANFN
jgi:hypothetical protein